VLAAPRSKTSARNFLAPAIGLGTIFAACTAAPTGAHTIPESTHEAAVELSGGKSNEADGACPALGPLGDAGASAVPCNVVQARLCSGGTSCAGPDVATNCDMDGAMDCENQCFPGEYALLCGGLPLGFYTAPDGAIPTSYQQPPNACSHRYSYEEGDVFCCPCR
jgi:hypothetical protein